MSSERNLSLSAIDPGPHGVCPTWPPVAPETMESGSSETCFGVFRPESYTPSYDYPLIIWFHDDGGDERDVLDWTLRISPQNYLGLGLRGPLPVTDGLPRQRRWSTGPQHVNWVEDQLAVALFEACQRMSIHCERIVAAGIGRGATIALQMLLRRPDLFAAAACLNAGLPRGWCLDRWGQYIGRSIWLGHSGQLASGSGTPAISAAGVFHAAGMQVTPRVFDDDEWPPESLGRELDWWLMHTLCSDTVVA